MKPYNNAQIRGKVFSNVLSCENKESIVLFWKRKRRPDVISLWYKQDLLIQLKLLEECVGFHLYKEGTDGKKRVNFFIFSIVMLMQETWLDAEAHDSVRYLLTFVLVLPSLRNMITCNKNSCDSAAKFNCSFVTNFLLNVNQYILAKVHFPKFLWQFKSKILLRLHINIIAPLKLRLIEFTVNNVSEQIWFSYLTSQRRNYLLFVAVFLLIIGSVISLLIILFITNF